MIVTHESAVAPQLKKKKARAAALEKQLQEKTSAYSLAALKNTELENQLQVRSCDSDCLIVRKLKESYKLVLFTFLIEGEEQQSSALPVADDQKATGVSAGSGKVQTVSFS